MFLYKIVLGIVKYIAVALVLFASFMMIISMSDDYWSNKAVTVNVHMLTVNGAKYKWFVLSEQDRDTNAIKINNQLYLDNMSCSTEFFNNNDSNDYYTEADCNDIISNSSIISQNALEDGRIYFKSN